MQKKRVVFFRILENTIALALLLLLFLIISKNAVRFYSFRFLLFLYASFWGSHSGSKLGQLREMKKVYLAQISAFQDAAKLFAQAKDDAAFSGSISEPFAPLTNALKLEYASKFSIDAPNASVERLPSGAVMLHIAFPRCFHWRFLYVPEDCTVREVKIYLAMQKRLGEGWYAIRP